MSKQFFRDVFIYGFILWFIGYFLGIILFPFVPSALIGWIIMPVGIFITLWVLLRKVHVEVFRNYVFLGIAWVFIAIICDYFFLVKLFKPTDGYYKLDVYLYYLFTLVLPFLIGLKKSWKK